MYLLLIVASDNDENNPPKAEAFDEKASAWDELVRRYKEEAASCRKNGQRIETKFLEKESSYALIQTDERHIDFYVQATEKGGSDHE